jgi:hypothetical protein
VKNEEASILMRCHCPGLPGTVDPRIAKALKAAAKDPALQPDLDRQQSLDERNLTALEQVVIPQPLLEKLVAGHAAGAKKLGGKAFFLQPIGMTIIIGAFVLIGWGGLALWNHAHAFPGKDSVARMVDVNEDMTGMELEPKKDTAGALNDWFFNKYGFEDYFVPDGFKDYQAAGARLFKQDDEPVAQVAIPDHNMVFFSFKAEDFGVNLPNDQWQIFTEGNWVAAVQQHDEECFMVTFRGSQEEMQALLNQASQAKSK